MGNRFVDDIQKAMQNLTSMEQILGKGLNIPNNATSSGARKIMSSQHQSHTLVLTRAELPYVGTGYENRFGALSSSVLKVEDDMEVLAKISKFSFAPDHHYYLLLRNRRTDEITYIERISYHHSTNEYGYLLNNARMDQYQPGMVIPKGDVVRRSVGYDSYGNKTNGTNVNVTYMALDHNMEDSIIISESCSKKMESVLVKKVSVTINENDIPLNIYGNDNLYKAFPDIGEHVKNKLLLAFRREKREEAIFAQSVKRLQEPMMSDDKRIVKGYVADVDIYCNNPEHIQTHNFNQQLNKYYQERLRVAQELQDEITKYLSHGYRLSYELQKLFTRVQDELNGKKFIEDDRQFSNIVIKFTLIQNILLNVGDKCSDRYGGKGVVSMVVPDHLMPRMENGRIVEMIKNSSTMYGRENAGQIFELETNFISMMILDRLKATPNLTPQMVFDEVFKFLDIKSPEESRAMRKVTQAMSPQELQEFAQSILSRDCIYVSNRPLSETMDLKELERLYEAFPWIHQIHLLVPMTDSNGNIRFVKSRRTTIMAPQYCLRLKQFAREKYSATALSSINLKGENAKSKAAKNYQEPNSTTPIKFGQMETGDLDHMGTENVLINLLLHSLSPHGRRAIEEIMTMNGDPYNVNIKLPMLAKNRSAEILNARLKTMGYRLVFKKIAKPVHLYFDDEEKE